MSYTQKLRKQLPGILFFNVWIILVVLSSSSVPQYNPPIFAQDDIESICTKAVSLDISRRKEQLASEKEVALLAVGAVGGVITAGGGLVTGGVAAPLGVAAAAVTAMAIVDNHGRALQALNNEEDRRIDQCARDAEYLRDEADAAEQGEEGAQSTGTIPLIGFGFGTRNPTGVTGGEFLL